MVTVNLNFCLFRMVESNHQVTPFSSISFDVQVRIDSLNPRWVSSLMCGVTCLSPEKTHFPLTALGFKKKSWIICSDCVFHNGVKVRIACTSCNSMYIDVLAMGRVEQ